MPKTVDQKIITLNTADEQILKFLLEGDCTPKRFSEIKRKLDKVRIPLHDQQLARKLDSLQKRELIIKSDKLYNFNKENDEAVEFVKRLQVIPSLNSVIMPIKVELLSSEASTHAWLNRLPGSGLAPGPTIYCDPEFVKQENQLKKDIAVDMTPHLEFFIVLEDADKKNFTFKCSLNPNAYAEMAYIIYKLLYDREHYDLENEMYKNLDASLKLTPEEQLEKIANIKQRSRNKKLKFVVSYTP